MARGGINMAVVKEAREALLARGLHPSIDAVRVELGNTGSKSTIHRYLKELEETDFRRERPIGLSEELSELVGRVAERLESEAAEHIKRALAHSAQEKEDLQEELSATQAALEQLKQEFSVQQISLEMLSEEMKTTGTSLQVEQTRNARLSQANSDLEIRVKDKDDQIKSLEEKHLHARDALEHYRNSVRDQREQDLTRHENQVQQLQMEVRTNQQTLSVKQDEITHLNRDNERLINEIRQLNKTALEVENQKAVNTSEIEALKILVAQGEGGVRVLSNQVTEMQERNASLTESLNAKSVEVMDLRHEIATMKLTDGDSAS